MRLANRLSTDHTALVLLECLVAALAVLGTVITLLGVALAGHVLERGVGRLGAHPAFAGVGSRFVALVGFLVLLGGVRLAVVEYRRFFDRAPETRRPLALGLMPLAGVAIPFGYAVQVTGSTRPPWLLTGLAVLSAHALAFRTLSAWSRDPELERLGELVAVVAGTPLIVALVAFVTDAVPVDWLRDAGRLLLDTPGTALVPRDGLFLVAFPLVVGGAFGAYRSLRSGDRVDVPEPDLPRVEMPFTDAMAPVIGRLLPDASLTDVALASANRLHEYATQKWGRTDRPASADAPPVPTPPGASKRRPDGAAASPATPHSTPDSSSGSGYPGPRPPSSPSSRSSSGSSPSTSSSSSGTATSTSNAPDSSASNAAASTAATSDTAPSASGSEGGGELTKRVKSASVAADPDASDDTDGGAGDSTPSSSDGDASATDAEASPSSDESGTTDGSDSPNPDADRDSAAGSDSDDGEPDDTEPAAHDDPDPESDESLSQPAVPADDSRTQIYPADVGADGSAESVIETCPDCDADVPSDGTYEFCPLCGHEL